RDLIVTGVQTCALPILFGVSRSQVDAEMRRKIKAMSYGLAYGLSAFGLSQQLNIEAAEARALMDTYFERFGGVRDYLHRAVEERSEERRVGKEWSGVWE